MTPFQRICTYPTFYTSFSGGAYEPSTFAIEAVADEAQRRIDLACLDSSKFPDIEAQVWSEFYNICYGVST